MVAPRKSPHVFCTIVRVPVAEYDRMVIKNRITRRPSDRLPWSDPIIAQLVTKLQDEVRGERRQNKLAVRTDHGESADLAPSSPAGDLDYEWRSAPRWDWRDIDRTCN